MFSTLYILTFTFWTFGYIQNAKASTIFKLSGWNFFCMFHIVSWTKLGIRIFIFYLLFNLKNNFHTTDTRKIKKNMFWQIFFFFLLKTHFSNSDNYFLCRCIEDTVKNSRSCTLNLCEEIDFENRPQFPKLKKS